MLQVKLAALIQIKVDVYKQLDLTHLPWFQDAA